MRHEPGSPDGDVSLDEPSGAGAPPPHPFGQLPSNVSSSSDSDGVTPKWPQLGGQATINWTAPLALSPDTPANMDGGNFSSSKSNSTKRPGDPPIEDFPPSHRLRTSAQIKRGSDADAAELRDRLSHIPYAPSTATGTAPYASTPHDIENAPHNSMVSWSAYNVMFPKR